jgi:hypothetical protein
MKKELAQRLCKILRKKNFKLTTRCFILRNDEGYSLNGLIYEEYRKNVRIGGTTGYWIKVDKSESNDGSYFFIDRPYKSVNFYYLSSKVIKWAGIKDPALFYMNIEFFDGTPKELANLLEEEYVKDK